MNDQHAHAGYVGYDGYPSGSFDTDPLFGALPGSYEAGYSGQYDSTGWDTGSQQVAHHVPQQTAGYDPYAVPQQTEQYQAEQFQQYDTSGQYDAAAVQYDTTGQWDASAWNQSTQTGQYETAAAAFSYDTTGQWAAPVFETGTYDATAWNAGTEAVVPQQFTPEHEFGAEATPDYGTPAHGTPAYGTTEYQYEQFEPHEQPAHEQPGQPEQLDQQEQFAQYEQHEHYEQHEQFATETETGHETGHEAGTEPEFEAAEYDEYDAEPEPEPEAELEPLTAATPVTPRPVRRSGGSRGRRRTPAKRSALLTVAVPSACVMGVAGIAAASVGSLGSSDTKDDAVAAADPSSVKPIAANNKMDTQLAALSADARDFGDRASRTQERIDLKARQEAEKQRKKEEAERRERLRPKFALPVKQNGLSAYYGQAGVNWMSLHTGIDFPVSYGTEVMAATDGTIRTQYNGAYGNMAIVTAADGTETWYCHLSSTKIRSGSVKAGDVIAYSGNSGNSTGPHLHFEVRPGGGSAIDPLPWLRSHGLEPT
ncbi:M23 family metallopeptidase [Streptomyces sp. NPDC020681]|uniref:M23 family metallopeptidase n=1 Tax=Streptomyces sp. NPDC020681 TaxID=3365083 RepID=UPI00379CBEEB